jgi:CBS domain-containing protein
MRIEQLMTRAPRTCRPSDRLSRAAQLMRDHDCGCVPVVADDGKVIGVLTDRDVCMAAYRQGTPADGEVARAMSRQVHWCRPADSIEVAAHVMRSARVRRLPVIAADGGLVGIVSLDDLALAAADEPNRRLRDHLMRQVEQTLAEICRPHSAMANGDGGTGQKLEGLLGSQRARRRRVTPGHGA